MALRVICADAMGRDAVASSLIKTRLVNVEESLRRRREGEPAKAKVSFEGGVLEMRCAYAVGISKGDRR